MTKKEQLYFSPDKFIHLLHMEQVVQMCDATMEIVAIRLGSKKIVAHFYAALRINRRADNHQFLQLLFRQ